MAVPFHCFPLPEQGNKLWPLPPDYQSLDKKGQKMARVNGCRARVKGRPDLYTRVWQLWRTYYLSHPDAFWYDGDPLPSPPLHYELAKIRAAYPLSCILAPRESAKSTVFREMALLDAVALPRARIGVVKATDGFVTEDFQRYMDQLENNSRIVDDFGRLKPKKGAGLWNHKLIKLTNGAVLKGMSVTGKLRGNRFDLLCVDDPEDDKEFAIKAGRSSQMSVSRERLLKNFETLLFNKLMRMRAQDGTLMWLGTMIDTRSFIYRIVTTQSDTRFKRWHRIRFDGETPDGKSCWEARWSAADLEQMKQDLGPDAYNREHRNLPGTSGDALLKTAPETHHYWLADPAKVVDMGEPLKSTAKVCWNDVGKGADGQPMLAKREEEFGHFAQKMTRIITVDYALPGITHDWSAISVAGIDTRNTLWSLDMWVGKVTTDKLLQQIWTMATRWSARVIGVEAMGLQEAFYNQVRDFVDKTGAQLGFIPQCVPIRHRVGVSKPERIGAMEWRFRTSLIKFPAWRLHEHSYDQLMWQIGAFTNDLRGLDHDDAIDALSMTQHLVKAGPQDYGPALVPKTPVEMLLAGQMEVAPGIPTAGLLNACDIPMEFTDRILREHWDKRGDEDRTNWEAA